METTEEILMENAGSRDLLDALEVGTCVEKTVPKCLEWAFGKPWHLELSRNSGGNRCLGVWEKDNVHWTLSGGVSCAAGIQRAWSSGERSGPALFWGFSGI